MKSTWKQLMENILTEGKEIEYYIEDKLLSVALPTGEEATELSFVVTGGSDEDEGTVVEKQRGINLLRKVLKLLQDKGYFGDVGEFLSRADVKRKLSAYGIMQAPLSQPINHKILKRMLIQSGLKVVSATQYDKEMERQLDKQADPEELQRYKDSMDQDDDANNVTLAQDLKKKQDKEPEVNEESMNLARRILHRKALQERNINPKRLKPVYNRAIVGNTLDHLRDRIQNAFKNTQYLQKQFEDIQAQYDFDMNEDMSEMLNPVFEDLEAAIKILDDLS